MERHPFPAVWDQNSRILILGSFPSVKSREANFYYGHPKNRFWQVLSGLFGCGTPGTIPEKRALLSAYGIALWDVLAACEITGSSDASIKRPVPNDLAAYFAKFPVRAVFLNGATAHRLYVRYACLPEQVPAIRLPSTSPANAQFSLPKLMDAWKVVLDYV